MPENPVTRRSPETRPVHLTRADLRRAIAALDQQSDGAETLAEARAWKSTANKLRAVLLAGGWVGPCA